MDSRLRFSAHSDAMLLLDGTPRTLASHAAALPLDAAGAVPEWVHVLPLGEFRGRDGRGPYRMENAQAVLAATNAYRDGQPLPIDYDHQLELTAENGAGAPASGWMTAFEARPDGIWARVEWTPAATERLAQREYRFLSPVFAHRADGTVLFLARAGLTNRPNLAALTAINAAQHTQEDSRMSDALKAELQRIAGVLGLPITADGAAIAVQASTMVESERIARGQITMLRSKLKLADTAGVDEIILAAQATAVVDPAQYVPMAAHSALTEELRTLRTQETARVVDAAIAAGKLIPAQRDWGLSYHASNPTGFATFVEKQPVLVEGGKRELAGQKPAADTGKIDEAGLAVCSQLGLSTDAYLKTSNS